MTTTLQLLLQLENKILKIILLKKMRKIQGIVKIIESSIANL